MSNCIHMSSAVFSVVCISSDYLLRNEGGPTRPIEHKDDILSKCLATAQSPHQDDEHPIPLLCIFWVGPIVNIGC